MKARKITLLAGISFLLCVCVVQAVLSARNPVKILKIEDGIDEIIIEKIDEKTELKLDGKDWFIGEEDFMVNMSDANNMVNNLKEVKILDTVGKLGNEDFNSRYDLTEEKIITVTAFKNGKEVRKINIGKASSTGSQTYITVGNSKDINLVSGNLYSIFSKSKDSIKSKFVFGTSEKNITSCKVSTSSSEWGIQKSAPIDGEISWSFTGAASSSEIDTEKADAWISQISSCTASEWVSKDKILPSKKEVSFEIESTEGKITLDIYSEKNGDTTKYICVSNKTSHKFELSESNAKKYIKSFSDLKK